MPINGESGNKRKNRKESEKTKETEWSGRNGIIGDRRAIILTMVAAGYNCAHRQQAAANQAPAVVQSNAPGGLSYYWGCANVKADIEGLAYLVRAEQDNASYIRRLSPALLGGLERRASPHFREGCT